MDGRILATTGLACDMIGAILVSIEVVRTYKGSLTNTIKQSWSEIGYPTDGYKIFEIGKRRWMAAGLFFLLIGFILQRISQWA